MRLVIAVVGCRRNLVRMATVRATWAAAAPAGVEVDYFVGGGPEPVPDWVVQLQVPDDYASLPLKVHVAHRWLEGRDFDWVFKCDDDTYVVIDRLQREAATMRPGEFLGSSAFHPVFASGGAGYLISGEASAALGRLPPPPQGPEDVLFSQRLAQLGYLFRPSARLRYDCKPDDLPRANNDIVTCHWLSPRNMRRLHDDLVGSWRRQADAEASYRGVHAFWAGEVLLFPDGFFSGGAAEPDGLWRREAGRLHLTWFSWPETVLEADGAGWRCPELGLIAP